MAQFLENKCFCLKQIFATLIPHLVDTRRYVIVPDNKIFCGHLGRCVGSFSSYDCCHSARHAFNEPLTLIGASNTPEQCRNLCSSSGRLFHTPHVSRQSKQQGNSREKESTLRWSQSPRLQCKQSQPRYSSSSGMPSSGSRLQVDFSMRLAIN